jgi:hypothetical protein
MVRWIETRGLALIQKKAAFMIESEVSIKLEASRLNAAVNNIPSSSAKVGVLTGSGALINRGVRARETGMDSRSRKVRDLLKCWP